MAKLKKCEINFNHQKNRWTPIFEGGGWPLSDDLKFNELEKLVIAHQIENNPELEGIPKSDLILVNPGSWQVVKKATVIHREERSV